MKQVIVVNQSLKLPKGKLAAQVAHAAVGAFVEADDDARVNWLEEGMPKVVLGAPDERLQRLLELALQAGIPALLVRRCRAYGRAGRHHHLSRPGPGR